MTIQAAIASPRGVWQRVRHRLSSKLSPPRASPFEVPRTQACERVLAASEARLVLIRAAAGFGKSTLMLQLRERFRVAGMRCAWLTVDDADNDIPRFVTSLSAALDEIGLSYRPVDNSDTAAAPRIIDRIASSSAPFALLLDDFEAIQSPAVLSLVAQIIDNVPVGGRVVIGTRSGPSLGLARLRAKGRMIEIDSAQLRFSIDETTRFLRERRSLPLAAYQVIKLYQHTDGWAAGLWLASVALSRCSDVSACIAGFSGSSAAVADYLAEDVFASQTERLKRFLLETSILDELTPSLCDAVRKRSDSAEILDQLEHEDLFLVALSGGRHRYDHLFAEFLRGQLERKQPAWMKDAHQAAADWYVAQGQPVPAIQHALAVGYHSFALELIAREAGALLLQGRFELLVRWLDSLPTVCLQSCPMLLSIHLWAVAAVRGAHAGMTLLDRLSSECVPREVAATFLTVRPTLLGMQDRIDDSYAALPEAIRFGLPDDRFAQGIFEIVYATTTMMLGRYAEARQHADKARRVHTGTTSFVSQQLAEWMEGSLDIVQGRLQQAIARLKVASHAPGACAGGNLLVESVLAEALYEHDQCEQAEQLLKACVPLAEQISAPDQLISSHIILSRIVGDRDEGAALQLLTELEQIGHMKELRRAVVSAYLERARRLVNQGDSAAAKEALSRANDPDVCNAISRMTLLANDVETPTLGRLRLQVRSGAASTALPGLKRELEAAERAGRQRRALKYRILIAEALQQDGQSKLGMRTLGRAVKLAVSEGFVRTFLDEGPVVEGMLKQLFVAMDDDPECELELPSSVHLERLMHAVGRRHSTPAPVPELVEPLTPKERQVLELLAQGLSNNAIADKLFISETTVRTHLRNINAKLNVGSRTQAIAAARRLRLIR